MNLNNTLKQMLGITFGSKENQSTDKLSSQVSNLITRKFGESAIDHTQLSNEFESKYLQKLSYIISKKGMVTHEKDFLIQKPVSINEAI